MNDGTGMILFMIAFWGGVMGLIYFFLQVRHKERVMLIEKGADAKLFQTEPRKKNYFFTMVLGILFTSISLGIGLGYVFESWMYSADHLRHNGNPGPYFFTIFLMLGIGFISSFFLHKKLINKE